MKTIQTALTREQFEAKLFSLCKRYKHYAPDYADSECFAAKYRNGRLRLMYHVRHVGNRDGYSLDMLYARLKEREDGRVTVSYFAGKPLFLYVAMTLWNLLAVPLFVYSVWVAIWNQNVQVTGILVSGLLSAVGLFLLFARSKERIRELEARLVRICRAEPQPSDKDE